MHFCPLHWPTVNSLLLLINFFNITGISNSIHLCIASKMKACAFSDFKDNKSWELPIFWLYNLLPTCWLHLPGNCKISSQLITNSLLRFPLGFSRPSNGWENYNGSVLYGICWPNSSCWGLLPSSLVWSSSHHVL